MKVISWLLLALGILVFFEARDQLTGWIGVMLAITGAAILIYRWGRDTGYPTRT